MLKQFFTDSFFYGFFLFLSKITSLITLPIVTYYFIPKDFAIADSYLVLINFIVPCVFLGLDSSVGRFYNEFLEDNKVYKLIPTTFFPGLLSSLIITLLFLFFSKYINNLYINQLDQYNYLPIIILNIIPLYIILFSTNVLKFAFKKWSFVIISMLNPLCFSLSIILLGYFFDNLTLYNYFISFLFFNCLFACYSLYILKNDLMKISIDKSLLISMYKYGIPFFFVSLLGISFSFAERLIINNYFPIVIAGLYMFSYRIVNILSFINRLLQISWGPFSISNFKNKNASKEYNKVLYLLTFILNAISIFIMCFDTYIVELFGNEKYINSIIFIPFLLGANNFLILSSITNIGINIKKKTTVHIFNYLLSFILFISIFFILKPFSVLLSLPFALLISRMILFINQSIAGNRLHNSIQFKWFIPCVITFLIPLTFILLKYYPYYENNIYY